MKPKEFVFDPKKHVYTLDGKNMTGVTAIIGIIGKPWLVPWAAKMVVEAVKEKATPIYVKGGKTLLGYQITCEDLDEAKGAHKKKATAAADIGTLTHKWIEDWIQNPKLEPNPEIEHITKKFVDWATINKVKFLESEIRVYSEKYWYAGTCDLVMEIDGKVWIGDIKTSSGIAPENFFQTSAYQTALQEMQSKYPEVEGNIIINCKKTGEFHVERSYGYKDNFDSFLACLKIYRIMEQLKTTIN